MEVLDIQDQSDGSAILTFDMSEEENILLVEYAVIDILKKQISQYENSWENIKKLIAERFE